MSSPVPSDKSPEDPASPPSANTTATTDYCQKLQRWMWSYHCGYASWQSWVALSTLPFPPPHAVPPLHGTTASRGPQAFDARHWYNYSYPLSLPGYTEGARNNQFYQTTAGAAAASRTPTTDARSGQLPNGTPAPPGREYTVPSPLQRFMAETVDFFILFCVKATIVLCIMHLSGMKDIAKFITHFIVEEIDENTSMEDLQKMMAVALVYRVLVCVYETICIWTAGGATPGKFLLGLQVVMCDTTTIVRPNRVLVVPATDVSLSASAVRALNKNFSIAFLFPVFITLLFFQHNRTVYDIVAGTIVVQRRTGR
ncbi:protein FAM8A1 isoform X2 [Eucyclogobius newberryi]|uniref:protein FAM8A1 isoform X2 n=1 Tax=Eucyclogobius newberryi TaxID=166745 RepID=UPI003B5A4D30